MKQNILDMLQKVVDGNCIFPSYLYPEDALSILEMIAQRDIEIERLQKILLKDYKNE